ncbi:MAG TPA: hypothetical protein ENK18_24245, partial [Deltaproteobacteria bacterium]|nr:hypothetical protein [Deltaproteobacteria bacterium]
MGQVRVDELDNGSPYLGWPGDPAGWGEGLEVAIDDARASVILPATGPAWGLSGRAILQTGFLIDAEAQGPGSLARILYQAAREVRMAQRTAVACWVPPGRRAWLQGLGFQPVPGLSTPDGSLQLFAADVGSALYRLAGEAASGGQAVPASVLVDEIGQTLERFFERIW